MRLSLIIPAYDEEKRIGRTLEEYCVFFRCKKIDFEIIVVLNNCKDNTINVVKEFQKKFEEIKFLEFEDGGKGFAIMKGFEEALKRNNTLIGFVDADMATRPESFYDLIEKIKSADGIIASRGMKESDVNFSLKRKITHKGFNFLVKSILFLNYYDTQCGAKLFKRKVIEEIIDKIGITKWAFDVDLLYQIKRKEFVIKEIPTIWEDQSGSKLNLGKVPFKMFSAVIRLRLIYSPFKFIVTLYDKFPEKIKINNI